VFLSVVKCRCFEYLVSESIDYCTTAGADVARRVQEYVTGKFRYGKMTYFTKADRRKPDVHLAFRTLYWGAKLHHLLRYTN
jgi:hypothetical protein